MPHQHQHKLCEKQIIPPTPNFDGLNETRQIRYLAVKNAIQHAWHGYANTIHLRKYTSVLSFRYWFSSLFPPADDLAPLSQTGITWLNGAATLYDSLDTLYLAGLHEEFEFASGIVKQLPLPLAPTKTFEYSIRVLGGLLGGYAVSGDVELLSAARRVADSMLEGAFKSSPTALPRMYDIVAPSKASRSSSFVSWSWGGNMLHHAWALVWRYGRDFLEEHKTNSLAGVGSFALEFAYLSALTDDQKYTDAADAIFQHVTRRKASGSELISMLWDVQSGNAIRPNFTTLGSGSDSFYEYLIKTPILLRHYLGEHNDKTTKATFEIMSAYVDQYKRVIHQSFFSNATERHVLEQKFDDEVQATSHYFPIDEHYKYSHLLCYVPGMLALGEMFYEDKNSVEVMEMAKNLTKGCWSSYKKSKTNLGPEEILISSFTSQHKGYKISNPGYFLRPEFVESIFILYRLTGEEQYQEIAWQVFESLEMHSRREIGYAGILNVDEPGNMNDEMPSFFIAETLKYLLLTFAPDNYIDLSQFVFTTEAHPLRQMEPNSRSGVNQCLRNSFDSYQPISPILVLFTNMTIAMGIYLFMTKTYRLWSKNVLVEKKIL